METITLQQMLTGLAVLAIAVAGIALNEWSLWALLALVLVAISLHLLVLVEEAHLRFRLGDEFTEFCQKTPRYIGA